MSVYLITAREVGKVKIGCANDPWDRLEKLRTASPVELSLEAVLAGAYEEERAYHQRFAAHRVRGEWFNLCPEIESLILASAAPVRGFDRRRSQRRKLLELIADNDAIEARAGQRRKSDEELADEQIERERALYAEAMRDFAALEKEAGA